MEISEWAYLALKVTSIFDTEDLWSVPGVAADTLQPVQVILVENLRRSRNLVKKPVPLNLNMLINIKFMADEVLVVTLNDLN